MPAVSKKQQRLMGIVHGLQKGTVDPAKVSGTAKDIAFGTKTRKPMKKKAAHDFAATKHAGLPTKKKKNEGMITSFDGFVNEDLNAEIDFDLLKLELAGELKSSLCNHEDDYRLAEECAENCIEIIKEYLPK